MGLNEGVMGTVGDNVGDKLGTLQCLDDRRVQWSVLGLRVYNSQQRTFTEQLLGQESPT